MSNRKGAVLDFLSRFIDPLVVILLVISIVSFVMGDLRSVVVVLCMLFISVVLSQNANLTKVLEGSGTLPGLLLSGSDFEIDGFKVAVFSSRSYEQQRLLFDCVAFETR
jgi:hypothetical protein